jgi:beta-mannosidase
MPTPRHRQHLHDGWSLRCHRAAEGAPSIAPVAATVPGCVHTDLLAHGLIPDPFADEQEQAVAWVADCDWAYACRFDVDPAVLSHQRVELVFDGLDTLATITLNGVAVATTANMHRRYRFDVTGLVQPVGNELEVVFRSATEEADRLAATEGEWPSSSFGRRFNYLRKMACSWGWDWGPWLTTAGIWRAAAIEGWSGARLADVRTATTIAPGERGRLAVSVDVARSDSWPGDQHVSVVLTDPTGTTVGHGEAPVTSTADGTVVVDVDAGRIERWWPHTLGSQPLYGVAVVLVDASGTVIDARSLRVGFRTVELDTTPDATGAAFTLVVNGRPTFVRGVNWIPDDVFPSRITGDDYRERLTQAVDANVDLIRVWGGGIYEDDRFYDRCDELGLLVWQDFLFACAAYPEHLLVDEVAAEAADNVSRLAHHASLAIWNGNNENLWGHVDWGWDDVLRGRSWGAGFYHDLLPRICRELDPTRPYWPGSPYSGSDSVAPNADAHGCVHVWDVWNQLDLDRYRDHTPRFVAEFGWQAPPSLVTMADHVSPGHFRRDSAAMRNHQKAADGDLKLDRGIVPRFGELDDLDRFWYAAQVVQARAVRAGVEHFRSLRPYCMGTIWWQLNDCWPVASWAVVDGAGRPKPAWYALRAAYRSQLLTIQPRGDRLALVAVNDGVDPWHLDARVRRIAFHGDELAATTFTATVAPGATEVRLLDPAVAVAGDRHDEVLIARDQGGAGGADAWWWYAPDRSLRLPTPALVVTQRTVDGGVELDISSSVVVRELTIQPERVHPGARADRQLIDLEPGAVERVSVTGVGADAVPQLLVPPVCWSIATLLS